MNQGYPNATLRETSLGLVFAARKRAFGQRQSSCLQNRTGLEAHRKAYNFWKILTSFFPAVSADPPLGLRVVQPMLLLYHSYMAPTSFTGGETGHQSKIQTLVTGEAFGEGKIPLLNASCSLTAAMGEP